MKALLAIAALVQQNGKNVTPAVVDRAREAGATDREIQDTVLIAALFCLYNKYVDGLASVTPADTVLIAGLFCLFNRYLDGLGVESADPPEALREWGKALAEHGYAG